MRGLYPSHANRWMNCGGSVALSQPFLEEDTVSEKALEGKAAHRVAELLHKGEVLEAGEVLEEFGVTVTEEMAEAARLFCDVVPRDAAVETIMPKNEYIRPGMLGKIDAVWQEGTTLHILDFKYGHRFVDEFENWQLLVYAAGYADRADIKELCLHVLQPRCYYADPERMWCLKMGEYMQDYLPRILEQADGIIARRAPVVTGTWCSTCPAAQSCNALAEAGYVGVDMSDRPSATRLDAKTLAHELDALYAAKERIEQRLTGLEENAAHLIKKGTAVPGYALQPGQGRERWSIPPERVFELGEMFGADLAKPREAVTPKQAAKAGVPATVISSYVERPATAAKLKPVDMKQARKAFSS